MSKIANFKDKVIDDDIYNELGIRSDKSLRIKLSTALQSLCKNYTILDFSYNFLDNLDQFVKFKHLERCQLLNLQHNRLDNDKNNWIYLVNILRIIPKNGYVNILQKRLRRF